MHLDRDDRGNYRDTIVVDGTPIENPLNQETVTVRGIVPGEYVVNIFHYSATTNEPVPVHVKIEKLNPTVTVLYYETINLNRTGQEETVARFVIDESGYIVTNNHVIQGAEDIIVTVSDSIEYKAKVIGKDPYKD